MIRQTKSKQRNLETPINHKRTTFQQQIRRARVQQLIKKMREQLITSICEDFHTLKNIDLDQCFDLIGQIKVEAIAEELSTLDNLVLNMYSYCVSNRSDHMYSLIRDSTLQKMIEMIAWARIESYSAKPRVYVRLMWILSNYCTYATTAPPAYFKTITELLKHFSSSLAYQDKKDLLFFTHAQAKLIVQLLFWSLGEVQISQQACLSYFVDKQQGFITAGVNESKKIVQLLKDHTLQQTDREMSILLHIIKMFQKFVTLSQYPKDLLQTILDFDYQIVNNLLEILSYVRMRYQTIEIVVAECFHSFFMQNLSQRPVILLSHRFNLLFECFQQTAENVVLWHSQMLNFHKKLDIQGESKATMAQLGNQATQSEYRLSRWLGVMVAIFGLNIPQNQDEKSYYQLQMGWLEDYLLPTFAKLLRLPQLKSRQLTTKIMNILQNICLDQALCELMLSQLAVANFIFRNCRAAQVRVDLRKGSLLCLANLTRMSMDAELRPKVLQFMDKKEIASIFAKYVGQFSEAGINFSLLQGLKTMLDVEPCETKKQNEIWWQFCSQGGRYKLEKLVQASGKEWKDLIIFAESIMKQYEDAEL